MGFCVESTLAMGEFAVEVRRESFYLVKSGKKGIIVYPDTLDPDHGTVELLLADIPKIRASLDAVEAYLKIRGR